MSSLFTTRSLQANNAFTTRHLKDDSIVANTIITGDGQRINVNDLLKGRDKYVTKEQMKEITNQLEKNIETNTKNIKSNNIKASNNSKNIKNHEERITTLENTSGDCLEKELTLKPASQMSDQAAEFAGVQDKNIEVTDKLKNFVEMSVQSGAAALFETKVNNAKITDHESRITTLETDNCFASNYEPTYLTRHAIVRDPNVGSEYYLDSSLNKEITLNKINDFIAETESNFHSFSLASETNYERVDKLKDKLVSGEIQTLPKTTIGYKIDYEDADKNFFIAEHNLAHESLSIKTTLLQFMKDITDVLSRWFESNHYMFTVQELTE